MASNITITVLEENSKQRIDKFLASYFAKAIKEEREFFSYSRGEIIQNIKNGNVLVNGKKIKPSYILKASDKILVNFPARKKEAQLIPNPSVKIRVIYQDENIIAIDKSAGIQVHPGGREKENTLVNGLIVEFPEIKDVNDGTFGSELRPGIVHRLDKDTSGIMVIARNQESFNELKKMFQARKVHKKYLAVVYGKIKRKEGIIEKPIARSGDYRKQVIAGKKTKTKIRAAVTEYEVIKEYGNYSLVEAVPRTGRTHQIRIHLFSLGNPIVGDKKYKIRTKKINNAFYGGRHLLHAEEIKFELLGRKYDFVSPLPDDFANFTRNID